MDDGRVQLWSDDGTVLLGDDGQVAVAEDCCCGEENAPCDVCQVDQPDCVSSVVGDPAEGCVYRYEPVFEWAEFATYEEGYCTWIWYIYVEGSADTGVGVLYRPATDEWRIEVGPTGAPDEYVSDWGVDVLVCNDDGTLTGTVVIPGVVGKPCEGFTITVTFG